jgi:CRISPR-associated endonuclease/helicase Cas3
VTGFPDFATFFRGLWGFDPFPWQAMLAERVALGHWPQALDLPTASGKTACIEVALWALASQADRPLAERTVPRRIWFVVDRRIVVDEAFERARTIAGKLAGPGEGPLGEVANRLRRIAGTDRPLAVARLRGGIFRDDGWARLPSQPTVITSTVDQVGSRLLFRGYGRSHMTAPIFAGLAANDSLVLLDEAHCSVPFLQTLRAIETYRGTRWAESPLATPFAFAVLSATPPPDIPEDAVFPGAAREQALGHPVLQQRLQARKPADLVELKTKGKGEQEDPVVTEAVRRVQAHLVDGKRRVAVMVNRVWTASGIAEALRECVGENADVVLLTGRMRPYERDRTVDRWKPFLKADSPGDPPKPIVVVSTQCLEVGADFSFDALITEAASLDALRQRFGRLDRMGAAGTSRAAILIRDRNADLEKSEPDAVYGEALARTWQLLKERAEVGSLPTIDFGVEALRKQLGDVDNLSPYLAPTADAPMLLPAHLDLLCQTAPTAEPEPDVQLFLHGKDRGAPEVRVVWRADLDLHDDDRAWLETIALCPPASGEMLAVPNYRLRAWLAESGAADDAADVEGVPASGEAERGGKGRRCLLWRGRDRSRVAKRADEIMPGEVVIVPAAYGMEGLGQPVAVEALGRARLDLWEPVLRSAGRPAAVRLNRAALEPWLECSPLSQLVTLAETPFWEREEIQEAIDAVLEYQLADEGGAAPPPSWWLDLLRETRSGRFEPHPAGGVVLFARGTANALRTAEPDLFADDDDLTSSCARGVSLDEHSDMVKRTVEKLARHCLPEELLAVLRLAAWWHDVGKLDERFQVLLHQGDELAALSADTPLAKSASIPTSPARRRTLREASGLPQSFRHEMLSAQIAERHAPLPDDRDQADLFLHLVASHHGHVRPFAPISADLEPTAVEGRLGDTRIVLSAEERATWTPHRVDSGLADRFWRLTRRYGWWGLAYLEAVLRLGDWYASGLVIKPGSQGEAEP